MFIFLDPVEYDLPMLKKPLHFYKDRSEAPEVLQNLNKIVENADCYLILTAEYNCTLPPALTNLMGQLPQTRLILLYEIIIHNVCVGPGN